MRDFDVVLFGATGFTGGLVAEVLAERLQGRPERWALAGRSQARLEQVRATLAGRWPGLAALTLLPGEDYGSWTPRARVVATTAGPYGAFGEPLLRACAENGTHYLDLTGEPSFVARSRETVHELAVASGAWIVHCCGFDSLPADLGALHHVLSTPASGPRDVQAYVRVRGTMSGGTWGSFLHEAGHAAPASAARVEGPRTPRPAMRPHRVARGWALPMPVIDLSIVRASARAHPELYGEGFTYRQYLVRSSLVRAMGLVLGVGAAVVGARLAPSWMARIRPAGAGPSPEERDRAAFEVEFVDASSGARTRVAGGDPGYTETSRMLAACALLLVRQDDLPGAPGVQTPACAFGAAGIEALREAGIRFEGPLPVL